jgi:hypothetical protein
MTTRIPSRAPLLAALAAVTLMTAGCATETTYRPATGSGFARQGYSDHQIEGDRWMVSFAGNSYTSRDTVEKYLLYRAAQLTLQQGFDNFVMADRKTDHRTRTYADDFGPYGFGGWGPTWRYRGRGFGWRSWDPYWGDPFWDSGLDIQTVDKFEANAEIVLGHGPKPANNIHAFDARDVIAHLGPTIVMPKS